MIKALSQRVFKYVLFLLPLAGITFAVFFVMQGQSGARQAQKVVEPPNKPAGTGIAASGIVEPVSQNIPIGSPVPGVVVEVIDFKRVRTPVKEGEVLFRLDDRQLKAELGIRKAALDSAIAQRNKLEKFDWKQGWVPNVRPEEIAPYDYLFKIKEAYLIETKYIHKAAEKLHNNRTMGDQEWGQIVRQLKVAEIEEDKAKADLALIKAGAWIFDREIQRKAVEQAQAQLKQVQTELERLEVRVPKGLGGYELLFINVFPGQFVGAPPGGNLILLGDTKGGLKGGLNLRVDIDEHDVPRFKVDEKGEKGPPAKATLRGQPGYEYELEYVRLDPYIIPKKSLTGDNSERVDTRVLQVIYRIKNIPPGAPRVYVGQQMDVFIQEEANAKNPS
jgi:multidrug efflux pump subunit AcrA (membrane-fusion protein)